MVAAWAAVAGILATAGLGATIALSAGAVAVLAVSFIRNREKRLRDQRILSGHCGVCGYDLRASPERCPECGSDLPEELQRRRRLKAARTNRRAAMLDLSEAAASPHPPDPDISRPPADDRTQP